MVKIVAIPVNSLVSSIISTNHFTIPLSISVGSFFSCLIFSLQVKRICISLPGYPGSEMHIRFTCKEKIRQEKKEPTDIDKGIVKWLVEMIDETNELTGIATILTMVAKKPVK